MFSAPKRITQILPCETAGFVINLKTENLSCGTHIVWYALFVCCWGISAQLQFANRRWWLQMDDRRAFKLRIYFVVNYRKIVCACRW